MRTFPVLIACFVSACGGYQSASPRSAATEHPTGVAEPAPITDLNAAALPFQFLDARTGRQIEEKAAWSIIAAARAVCVGEEHPNPHHHWAQLRIVEELVARAQQREAPIALGLEMMQRPMQGVLDDYAAGNIDEADLLSRSGWEERWGYDFWFYRQTLLAARNGGATLLALNAARELTKQVSRGGLDSLSAADRALVPELVLNDPTHVAWWTKIMSEMEGHGHGSASTKSPDGSAMPQPPDSQGSVTALPDPFYTVQVIWDETMADGAAAWLAGDPKRTVVILAGTGHCHDSAIVGRLARRGITPALSIRPVVDADGAVAEALVARQNDLLMVMSMNRQPNAD